MVFLKCGLVSDLCVSMYAIIKYFFNPTGKMESSEVNQVSKPHSVG